MFNAIDNELCKILNLKFKSLFYLAIKEVQVIQKLSCNLLFIWLRTQISYVPIQSRVPLILDIKHLLVFDVFLKHLISKCLQLFHIHLLPILLRRGVELKPFILLGMRGFTIEESVVGVGGGFLGTLRRLLLVQVLLQLLLIWLE